MTNNNDFNKDFKSGKEAEKWFANLLSATGNKNVEFNTSNDVSELTKWDIQCTNKKDKNIKFEIKWDKISTKTGNLALEFFSRTKPSGIAATTADFFVFLTNDEFYIFETKVLKELVSKMNFKSLCINNGTSYCYLMSKEIVKEYTHSIIKNNWY